MNLLSLQLAAIIVCSRDFAFHIQYQWSERVCYGDLDRDALLFAIPDRNFGLFDIRFSFQGESQPSVLSGSCMVEASTDSGAELYASYPPFPDKIFRFLTEPSLSRHQHARLARNGLQYQIVKKP